MKTLIWEQEGFNSRAQGLLRVYHILSEPIGSNRFRPAIQRGAVMFKCDVSFDSVEDAIAFCQLDHYSILAIHEDGIKNGLMTAQLIASEVIHREATKYAVIGDPIPGPPPEMSLSGLIYFVSSAITSKADKLDYVLNAKKYEGRNITRDEAESRLDELLNYELKCK